VGHGGDVHGEGSGRGDGLELNEWTGVLVPLHITALRNLQSGGIGSVLERVGDGKSLCAVAGLPQPFGDTEIDRVSAEREDERGGARDRPVGVQGVRLAEVPHVNSPLCRTAHNDIGLCGGEGAAGGLSTPLEDH
jgi:hypothetical protein